ncbi:hypothetical protein LLG95_15565, partial [bacterium]|nr:hypothetical protein [bacterium]
RILEQGWSQKDGIPGGTALFAWHAGPPWNKRYRLAHQANGACVFLNEKNLCRIHAKFGEAAKPRACRVYPFAFHPAGKKVTVSLRFSCPAVVANHGKSMAQQRGSLQALAQIVVPPGHERMPVPAFAKNRRIDWHELMRIVSALDETMAERGAPIMVRLLRALYWLKLVDSAPAEALAGDRIKDFLEFARHAAAENLPAESARDPVEPPADFARKMFYQLTGQYSRRDTVATLSAGMLGRWKLLRAGVRFARGRGLVPPMQDVFHEVPFAALEEPFGFPEASEELWTRYFRVKIQGLHFCGPAFYGLPLVEGFRMLALIFPATMWIARWLAASQGRTQLTPDDVARALGISDHHHGYSPLFGTMTFRGRAQVLDQTGEILKLIRWYAR